MSLGCGWTSLGESAHMTSLGYMYRWSAVVVQPDMISSAIAVLHAVYTSSPCATEGVQGYQLTTVRLYKAEEGTA